MNSRARTLFLTMLCLLITCGAAIQAQCPAPVVAQDSDNSLCDGDELVLTATITVPLGCRIPAQGTPYRWNGPGLPAPTAGNQLTVPAAVAGDYWVEVQLVDDNTNPQLPPCPCNTDPLNPVNSPPSNIVTVNVTPDVPISLPPQIFCEGGTATFTASAPNGTNSNSQFHWFNSSSASGDLLFIGEEFEAPGLPSNQFYYVAEVLGGCEGPRQQVNATVLPLIPPNPTQSNVEICPGDNTDLSATTGGANGKLHWYADQALTIFLLSGEVYNTGPLTQTTSYWVTEQVGDCESPSSTVTVTVQPLTNPSVTSPAICEGSTATITATSGGANGDFYWYGDAAGTNLLYIGNPYVSPAVSASTFYWVKEVSGNCESNLVQSTVSTNVIIPEPVASDVEICAGETAILSATITTQDGQVYWYDAATGGNLLAIGNTYETPSLSSTTSYFVQEVSGACRSVREDVIVNVNALPADPAVTGDAICPNNTATLTATGSGNLNWFESPMGGTAIASGGSYTTPNLFQSTYYYVQSENPVTGCISNRVAVLADVSAEIASPAAPSNVQICFGDEVTLSATGTGTPANEIRWYDQPTGGNLLQNDAMPPATSNFTPANTVFATTNFYVSEFDNNFGCESNRTPVRVEVLPVPQQPSVTAPTICSGQEATITAPGNGIYHWYDSDNGGNLLFSGLVYTTAELQNTTTYYVSQDEAGCESVRETVVVTVNPTPVPTVTGDEVCSNTQATLTASGNGVVNWYDAPSGGNLLTTGGTYVTPNLFQTTVYYVELQNPSTGCNSERTAVTATVSPAIVSPSAPANIAICFGDLVEITAIGSGTQGNELRWYDQPSGGTALQIDVMGNADATYSPANQQFATTNYYVSEYDTSSTCESDRTIVQIEVKPVPAQPSMVDPEICTGESTTLTAVGTGNFLWYDAATAGNLIHSGFEFTTPHLQSTTNYYLSQVEDGCESDREEITVTVNQKPAAPVPSNNGALCEGDALQLDASTVANATYSWSGPSAFTSGLQNPVINNVNEADHQGLYWVYVTDMTSGCMSDTVSTQVEVVPIPQSLTLLSNSGICEGDTLFLHTNDIAGANYDWSGPQGSLGTTTTPILPFPTASPAEDGVYSVQLSVNNCSSPVATTSVTVRPQPAAPQASNNGPVCAGDEARLMATTINNGVYRWSGVNGYSSTAQDPILGDASAAHAGEYAVRVTVNGCESDSTTTTLVVNALPDLPAPIASNSPLCEGDELQLSASLVTGVMYVWDGPNGFGSTQQNPSLAAVGEADNQGFYTLNLIDTATSCISNEFRTFVEITAAPMASAGSDVTIEQNSSVRLLATGGSTYQWSPIDFLDNPSIPDPVALPPVGTHTYVVEISNGTCSRSDSVVVEVVAVTDLLAYDVFTPDGDGKNDVWTIDFIENLDDYQLVVWDRGGIEILNTRDYQNDWDGTYQDRELPEGSYWYVIRTPEKRYKGAVSILR